VGKTKRGKLAEIFVEEAVKRLTGDNALGVSRSGFYDHEQKPDASADAKMTFWRKRFPCSFWQGVVLTVGVASKRALCAKGLRVEKSGSFG